jgi:hypothetical protein
MPLPPSSEMIKIIDEAAAVLVVHASLKDKLDLKDDSGLRAWSKNFVQAVSKYRGVIRILTAPKPSISNPEIKVSPPPHVDSVEVTEALVSADRFLLANTHWTWDDPWLSGRWKRAAAERKKIWIREKEEQEQREREQEARAFMETVEVLVGENDIPTDEEWAAMRRILGVDDDDDDDVDMENDKGDHGPQAVEDLFDPKYDPVFETGVVDADSPLTHASPLSDPETCVDPDPCLSPSSAPTPLLNKVYDLSYVELHTQDQSMSAQPKSRADSQTPSRAGPTDDPAPTQPSSQSHSNTALTSSTTVPVTTTTVPVTTTTAPVTTTTAPVPTTTTGNGKSDSASSKPSTSKPKATRGRPRGSTTTTSDGADGLNFKYYQPNSSNFTAVTLTKAISNAYASSGTISARSSPAPQTSASGHHRTNGSNSSSNATKSGLGPSRSQSLVSQSKPRAPSAKPQQPRAQTQTQTHAQTTTNAPPPRRHTQGMLTVATTSASPYSKPKSPIKTTLRFDSVELSSNSGSTTAGTSSTNKRRKAQDVVQDDNNNNNSNNPYGDDYVDMCISDSEDEDYIPSSDSSRGNADANSSRKRRRDGEEEQEEQEGGEGDQDADADADADVDVEGNPEDEEYIRTEGGELIGSGKRYCKVFF